MIYICHFRQIFLVHIIKRSEMEITLQQFEAMCQNRQLHNGYVEGLGCVFWRSRYVISSDTTSTESFSTPFYELVVIKDEKNIESGLQPLEGLIDKGTTALSLYGIANSFEQLSQKPIVIGEKYIQINRQGTLVRNPNRVYTTKGEVAKGVGRKIYFAGLIIDTALWISGKQTFSEAALNMGVNTGIYIRPHRYFNPLIPSTKNVLRSNVPSILYSLCTNKFSPAYVPTVPYAPLR